MTSATTPILTFGHRWPRIRGGLVVWVFWLFEFWGCRNHRGEGPVTSMEDLGFLVQVELLFGPGSGAEESSKVN
jgi:hypothetical protein